MAIGDALINFSYVTNNKIGCLLEKASNARPFKENIKKLYITKKLENKITFFTDFVSIGAREPLNTILAGLALLNYQPKRYRRPSNKLDCSSQ